MNILAKKIDAEIKQLNKKIAELETRLSSDHWEKQHFDVKTMPRENWIKRFIETDERNLREARDKLVKLMRKVNLE